MAQEYAPVEFLNSIGSVGLAFMLWQLLTGRLVTRREFDREVMRADKLDARLERALHIGDSALSTTDKLADRLPSKT